MKGEGVEWRVEGEGEGGGWREVRGVKENRREGERIKEGERKTK